MIPFASERMYRATLHHGAKGRVIYKVGAHEKLLERCSHALGSSGTLEPVDRLAILHAASQMAADGLRVLACARPTHDGHSRLEPDHVAGHLTFLGLFGLMDPPRPEAIRAAVEARGPSMISTRLVSCVASQAGQPAKQQTGLSALPRQPGHR
ncbi:MAG: hypothetical protein FJ404_12100 [Verrucomicrobia bacterium]|nr:hypothetical protein [Verrucomicrobiota bacterium]